MSQTKLTKYYSKPATNSEDSTCESDECINDTALAEEIEVPNAASCDLSSSPSVSGVPKIKRKICL